MEWVNFEFLTSEILLANVLTLMNCKVIQLNADRIFRQTSVVTRIFSGSSAFPTHADEG